MTSISSFYVDDKGNEIKVSKESSGIWCCNLYITESFILKVELILKLSSKLIIQIFDSTICNTLNDLILLVYKFLLVSNECRSDLICIMK